MFQRVMCAVAFGAIALGAVALGAYPPDAQAVPIGGGTSPRYCGSAWFTNSSGVGVCESSQQLCSTNLQNAINVRLGWGYVLQSTTPCSMSRWLGPPYTQVAPGEGDPSL